MSPLPELASCLAGLQKRLLPCLKYLVSQETLANGDKIQALMNLVDKPAAQEAPVFEDADLYYWAHLVLDPPQHGPNRARLAAPTFGIQLVQQQLSLLQSDSRMAR